MHTLHILPKDLHICKLPAVNVVDVEERCRKGVMDGRWKQWDFFFFEPIVPLNHRLFMLHNILSLSVYCLLNSLFTM